MAPRKLSFPRILHLAFTLIFRIPPAVFSNVIRASVRALLQRLPFRTSIWNATARAFMDRIQPDQIQAILPSTVETYRNWIHSRSSDGKAQVEILEDGKTHLLWLGERDSKQVILFFHGGGYVMPLSQGHLNWMAYLRDVCLKAGLDVSICVLEYSLIPENPYPSQLHQAVQALHHLLSNGYSLSDIIIGGDSAGGHLTLSLISALMHPYPASHLSLARPREQKLKGIFVVSPLLSFDLTTRSYNTRCSTDVLSPYVVRTWGNHLIDRSPWHQEISQGQGWGMALDVRDEWWAGLDDAVEKVLVTGGHEEIFRDHILRFVEVLQRMKGREVEVCMVDEEAHDGPLMDFSAGRTPGLSGTAIGEWVVRAFKC